MYQRCMEFCICAPLTESHCHQTTDDFLLMFFVCSKAYLSGHPLFVYIMSELTVGLHKIISKV